MKENNMKLFKKLLESFLSVSLVFIGALFLLWYMVDVMVMLPFFFTVYGICLVITFLLDIFIWYRMKRFKKKYDGTNL